MDDDGGKIIGHIEKLIQRNTKHGLSKLFPREYVTWKNMRQRCSNKKRPGYHRYGGRGISYTTRWDDFAVFLADMGPCPDGYSIDRFPDNNGNYEPRNCRWASNAMQARNRSTTKLTDMKASEIRAEPGASGYVGAMYDVSGSMVRKIKRNESWT